jgi:hypothetical protein
MRKHSDQFLLRIEDERRSAATEKRGTAKAALIGIRAYVLLTTLEPEVLRIIGEESQRNGTDKLTSRQIDQAIKAGRAKKSNVHDPSAGGGQNPPTLSPIRISDLVD